jgi:PHP family Zn ribbon phosphoesterase
MTEPAVVSSAADRPATRGHAMRPYTIDLHNHMPLDRTDYRGPLSTSGADVTSAAVAAGVDVLGVSDHFSLDFFRRVHKAAAGLPLLVLPGVEIRLSWGEDEAHLIALFPAEEAEERFSGLMSALGMAGASFEDPLHRIVVEYDPVDAARAIEALGGMCHVAHVDRWFGAYRLLDRPLLRRIVEEAPVVALEFLDLENASRLEGLEDRVACIRSSDSHHCDEIGRRSSVVEADEPSFEGIRRALALARGVAR